MTGFRDRFGLPAGMALQRAIDLCWTLNAPETYARLVGQCGWQPEDYQRWLAAGLRAAFLSDH